MPPSTCSSPGPISDHPTSVVIPSDPPWMESKGSAFGHGKGQIPHRPQADCSE